MPVDDRAANFRAVFTGIKNDLSFSEPFVNP